MHRQSLPIPFELCARYRMKWGDRQSVSKFKRDTVRCEGFFPIGNAPFRLVDVVKADERGEQMAGMIEPDLLEAGK